MAQFVHPSSLANPRSSNLRRWNRSPRGFTPRRRSLSSPISSRLRRQSRDKRDPITRDQMSSSRYRYHSPVWVVPRPLDRFRQYRPSYSRLLTGRNGRNLLRRRMRILLPSSAAHSTVFPTPQDESSLLPPSWTRRWETASRDSSLRRDSGTEGKDSIEVTAHS